jgi:hypothetical protein
MIYEMEYRKIHCSRPIHPASYYNSINRITGFIGHCLINLRESRERANHYILY